jgi:hypothetical protein
LEGKEIMRALICGSRNYSNRSTINWVLTLLKNDGYDTIIEGEARGADTIAREEALKLGLKVLPFPANWEENGKSAGYIRNQQMIGDGNPDIVIGFSTDIDNSRGTKDMLNRAEKSGIRTILIEN